MKSTSKSMSDATTFCWRIRADHDYIEKIGLKKTVVDWVQSTFGSSGWELHTIGYEDIRRPVVELTLYNKRQATVFTLAWGDRLEFVPYDTVLREIKEWSKFTLEEQQEQIRIDYLSRSAAQLYKSKGGLGVR